MARRKRSTEVEQVLPEYTIVPDDEVAPDGEELSVAVEHFCREYVGNNGNGTQAALAAFTGLKHTSARVKAVRLLARDSVRGRVKQLEAERKKAIAVNADRILGLHMEQATFDPLELYDEEGRLKPIREMSPAARRQLRTVKHTSIMEGAGTLTEVKYADPAEARRDLMRHLGIDKPKDDKRDLPQRIVIEVTHKLPESDWEAKYRALEVRPAPALPTPKED